MVSVKKVNSKGKWFALWSPLIYYPQFDFRNSKNWPCVHSNSHASKGHSRSQWNYNHDRQNLTDNCKTELTNSLQLKTCKCCDCLCYIRLSAYVFKERLYPPKHVWIVNRKYNSHVVTFILRTDLFRTDPGIIVWQLSWFYIKCGNGLWNKIYITYKSISLS